MNTVQIKKRLHNFIDQADERFLHQIYNMIESEQKGKEFFSKTDEDMVARAKASVESVEQGNTRSIYSFKEDFES